MSVFLRLSIKTSRRSTPEDELVPLLKTAIFVSIAVGKNRGGRTRECASWAAALGNLAKHFLTRGANATSVRKPCHVWI